MIDSAAAVALGAIRRQPPNHDKIKGADDRDSEEKSGLALVIDSDPVPGPELDTVTMNNFIPAYRFAPPHESLTEDPGQYQKKSTVKEAAKNFFSNTTFLSLPSTSTLMRDGREDMIFVDFLGVDRVTSSSSTGAVNDRRYRLLLEQELAETGEGNGRLRKRKYRAALTEEQKMKERTRKRLFRSLQSTEQIQREKIRKKEYRLRMSDEMKERERERKRSRRVNMSEEQKERERIRKREERARSTEEQKERERIRKRESRAKASVEQKQKERESGRARTQHSRSARK